MKKIKIAPPEQFSGDELFRLVPKFVSGPHKAPPKPKPLFPQHSKEKSGSR